MSEKRVKIINISFNITEKQFKDKSFINSSLEHTDEIYYHIKNEKTGVIGKTTGTPIKIVEENII